LATLAAAACNRTDSAVSTQTNPASDEVAADNTKRNQQQDTTSGDQAENAEDRTITQRIRQGVVADDDISVTGKNVKIITVDGVVTLRGPVKSVQEKTSIAKVAKQVDGVKRVENQLEVASN